MSFVHNPNLIGYEWIFSSRFYGFLDFTWKNSETEDINIAYIENLKIEIGSPTAYVPDKNLPWIKPNLVPNTSCQWSSWENVKYDSVGNIVYRKTFSVPEFVLGDLYTCSIEIETDGVKGLDSFIITSWFNNYNDNNTFLYNCFNPGNYFYLDNEDTRVRKIEWTGEVKDLMLTLDPTNISFRVVVYGRTEETVSGRIRVKNLSIKRGRVRTPIWTGTTDETRNTNLFSKYAINTSGQTGTATIKTTEVSDLPGIESCYLLEKQETETPMYAFGLYSYVSLDLGKQYTVSAYVKSSHPCYICEVSGSNILQKTEDNDKINLENWTKLKWTFIATGGTTIHILRTPTKENQTEPSKMLIAGYKVEKGPIAT